MHTNIHPSPHPLFVLLLWKPWLIHVPRPCKITSYLRCPRTVEGIFFLLSNKRTKGLSRHVFTEDTQMANKHIKRYSTSQIIRWILQYTKQFTDIRTATINKWKISIVGKEIEKLEPMCVADGMYNGVSTAGVVWKLLKELKNFQGSSGETDTNRPMDMEGGEEGEGEMYGESNRNLQYRM